MVTKLNPIFPIFTQSVWNVLLQVAHLSKNWPETYIYNGLQCKIRYPGRLEG